MTSSRTVSDQFRPWVEALEAMGEVVGRAARVFAIDVLPSLLAIADGLQRLPDELRPVVRTLAERGWFISGEMGMSELRHLQRVVETTDAAQLDVEMAGWIEEQLVRIENTAAQRFPAREQILAAAFAAHRAKTYELSVPVLLIQVEGMCIEILGRKLFATKDGVPRTKDATEMLIDGAFSEVILLPLREAHGLTASEGNRSNWPEAPNRHEILHGISTDYATKLTSQKAVSLLEYFVTFVASEKAKPQDAAEPDA
jgi:hypothetical protein